MRQISAFISCILFLTWIAIPASKAQWVQTNGLYEENIQAIAVNGANIYASTPDSGIFLSTNNGMNWTAVNSGLTNLNVYALAVNGSYLFAGTYGAGAFRSTDSGKSWTVANKGLTNTSLLSLFVDGTDLFAGTYKGGAFRSTNNGTNWAASSSGMTNNYVTYFVGMGTNLFAGTYAGVFLSPDSGANWSSASSDFVGVSALAVSGTNLFAAVAEMGAYLSTNNGRSWTNVSAGIPNINLTEEPVTAFAVSGTDVFAGSGSTAGVFLTIGDTTWSDVSTGLTTINNVISFGVSSTYLFAGTQGAGVWRRPLSQMINPSAVAATPPAQNSMSAYPNPLTQSTTITFSSPESGVAEVTIVNLLGTEVKRVFSGELEAGEHSFAWDAISEPPGMYECVVRVNGKAERIPIVLER